jgi:hypothetical protein
MATAKATTDHDAIRKWVEARGGRPARVKSTGKRNDPGVLRIDFPGFSGEDTLEEIEWDEFFEAFDRNRLAMLMSPGKSRFSKFVERAASRTASKSSGRTGAKSPGRKSSSRTAAKSSSRKTAAKKASAKKAGGAKKASSAKKSSAKKASSAKKSSSTKKASSAKKSSAKKSSPAKKASAKKSSAKKSSPAKRSSTKKSAPAKRSSASSITTTDHDEIRRWVDSRGGFPATVMGTESREDEAGVLRVDFPGYSGAGTLERIDWDDWFEKFDEENLAFVYQPKRGSRFSKLVRR